MIRKTKLGEILEFQRGYDLTRDAMDGGMYPVEGSTSTIGYHSKYKAENSIIIGRSGTVGQPRLVIGKFWPHNTALFSTTVKGNNLKYVYYLLLNCDIARMKSGSNIPTLNRNDLYPVTVLFEDDYEKQEEIANILDSIDAQINRNNKMVHKLQVLAQSIYSRWFIQFDFPNAEGKPYLSSGGKMVFNKELKREIPEGWKVKKLKDLLYKVNRVFDYSIEERTIDLSVMPNNSFFINEVNSSKNFSTNLFSMKSGDILFGSIRPYLKKAGIAPCDGALAGTVHCLNVYNKFDYNFCLLTLCSDNLFNYACKVSKGTKMPVISCEDLLEYPVAYNIDVIKKFFDVSLKEFVPCLAMENQKLYSLKKTIMPLLINQQLQ